MGKINWGRVFVCGLLTGIVSTLLQLLVLVVALRETDFVAAADAADPGPLLPEVLPLAAGIWTMWLYAAIRPRYGPGPKTAAVAGFAVWVLGALVNLYWVNSQLTPLSLGALLAPTAVALPAHIAATLVGAWQYKEGPGMLHWFESDLKTEALSVKISGVHYSAIASAFSHTRCACGPSS